jgi:hypothetical protein
VSKREGKEPQLPESLDLRAMLVQAWLTRRRAIPLSLLVEGICVLGNCHLAASRW